MATMEFENVGSAFETSTALRVALEKVAADKPADAETPAPPTLLTFSQDGIITVA